MVRVHLDLRSAIQLLLAEGVKSHTSTPLRLSVSVSYWLRTDRSKWSIFIGKSNRAANYLADHMHSLSLVFIRFLLMILHCLYIFYITYLKSLNLI
ncbi:hypothetical protein LINGRAPRIM_LOCUS2858 [Linum grandiflorum]